jgi:hypothetical protein
MGMKIIRGTKFKLLRWSITLVSPFFVPPVKLPAKAYSHLVLGEPSSRMIFLFDPQVGDIDALNNGRQI